MIDTLERRRAWAMFVARVILGLIFGMAGCWKVFSLGPIEHARQLFVVPYAGTVLPAWSLWAIGTVIPFVELVAGALLFIGWRWAGCSSSSRSAISCSSRCMSFTRMSFRVLRYCCFCC
jgi:hypothetical protein